MVNPDRSTIDPLPPLPFQMSRPELISITSRIVSLSRSGLLSSAQMLFDNMTERDTVGWNAMLSAYSISGLPYRTLSLFSAMRASRVKPDPFSFTSVLAAAADLHDLLTGEKLHSLALRSGLCSVPVSNALINMYGKCSSPSDAKRVFSDMEERNEVSWCTLLHGLVVSALLDEACKLFDNLPAKILIAWNIMIMGFACSDNPEMCLHFLKDMMLLGFRGEVLTFTSIVNSCRRLSEPCFGQMIHAVIIQNGWVEAVEVSNSVLSFYAKFGCHLDALRIFESMETRSQVSWNAMIDANMKLGDVKGAVGLFLEAPTTNIISWTSMVAGLARNGHGEEALQYFVAMLRNSHIPDEFTLGAVLHCCAMLTVLGNGLMVHGCVVRHGLEYFAYVANGLVNMYAKCGDIRSSSKVFDEMNAKDLVSWNAVIFGFAVHGWAQKALEMYEGMIASCVRPDKLTFLGLLVACCHSGLVEQGLGFLSSMETVNGVSPNVDHVTCVVDMLGRAGKLTEASSLFDAYSGIIGEGHAGYCEALLTSKVVHRDVKLGRLAGEFFISSEPQKEIGYVMLSNLYCFSGRWKEAEKVRTAMLDKGVKKTPGCSWIQVRDILTVFLSGASSFSHTIEVHNVLEALDSEMKHPSFIGFEWINYNNNELIHK